MKLWQEQCSRFVINPYHTHQRKKVIAKYTKPAEPRRLARTA
jgi:hypothetical protein